VLCQVEKAKEDMLNQLYSSVRLVIVDVLQFYAFFFFEKLDIIWYSGVLHLT
jgi:hypothetical protein